MKQRPNKEIAGTFWFIILVNYIITIIFWYPTTNERVNKGVLLVERITILSHKELCGLASDYWLEQLQRNLSCLYGYVVFII